MKKYKISIAVLLESDCWIDGIVVERTADDCESAVLGVFSHLCSYGVYCRITAVKGFRKWETFDKKGEKMNGTHLSGWVAKATSIEEVCIQFKYTNLLAEYSLRFA